MHFADLIRLASVEKDTLGGGGLTGVDMRHNTDIAIHIEWMAACHIRYSSAGLRFALPYRERGWFMPAPDLRFFKRATPAKARMTKNSCCYQR
jgi:hypothetical protein